MKILLVTATPFEVAPTVQHLQRHFSELVPGQFVREQSEVELLVSGVGLPLTAYRLGKQLARQQYDLAIQAGVAGAVDSALQLGEVVEVVSDCFADVGVEEQDGSFTSMYQLGLLKADEAPFQEGRLWNEPEAERAFLPQVHGISVNRVHGSSESITKLRKQYPFAQVESMEGAAFFLACQDVGLRALQIRSISNYVEPRNRENWQMERAITALNEVLIQIATTLTY